MDRRDDQDIHDGDEVAGLLRGLRLAVIAAVSAVVTAGLVIGVGADRGAEAPSAELIRVAGR